MAGMGQKLQQCNTKYYKQAELPSRAQSCCLTPSKGGILLFTACEGNPIRSLPGPRPTPFCSTAIVLLVKSNLLHTFVRRCNSHKMYTPYEAAVTFAQSHFGSLCFYPLNPAPSHLSCPHRTGS